METLNKVEPTKVEPTVEKPTIKVEEIKAPTKPDVALELLISNAWKTEKLYNCVDGSVLKVSKGKETLYLATRRKVNASGRVHYTIREYAEDDRACAHLGGLKGKS